MLRVIGCVTQQHDIRLVALAACICGLACFTTVNLLARAQTTPLASSWTWLFAAAAVFGCGVWSLHFVAMLAFTPGIVIFYRIPTTAISAVVAVIGAMLSFVVWRFAPSRAAKVGCGGLLLGLTVAAMHYSGVGAMQLPGSVSFDPATVWASFCVGAGFAIVGLARSMTLTSLPRRLEVSAWLALGICGLHFTGMAALHIAAGQPISDTEVVLASGSLAITVGSVSLAILFVSLAATLMEQHLSGLSARELQRMRLLSDVAREALIVYRDGIILQANAASARLFGVSLVQLAGRPVLEFFSETDHPTIPRRMPDQRANSVPVEIHARTAAGLLIPVDFSCGEIIWEGKPSIVIALRDLTDQKRDEERIRHFAHHDALTDLPNRFLLRERLTHDLAQAARSGGKLALLCLDLDRFKPVNDLLGHAAGDALLIQLADRLRGELREADILARIGGDEFVVFAGIDDPEDASILATRLIDAVSLPFNISGARVEIGTSIGIALYPRDGVSQDALMHGADTALYRAKRDKRGTFRFFEVAMDEQLRARRGLEQDLRHAIARNEMQLHYQPLINCATGDVEGFEALIRWRHPTRGMILPSDFIPLAEESGLIANIGQWVLETACRTAATWPTPIRVAVNVSPIQFRQLDLPILIATTLARTGLSPDRLEIEITEGVFMDGVKRSCDALTAIREQGVRMALDDFGTGYSSLSYLQSFKFDKLKIDKSFISRLGEGGQATMIVRTIIGLAHNLGLSIVAEGVETMEQLATIREYSCDQAQGYLFGRPMPMDGSIELIAARARTLLFGHAKAEIAAHERQGPKLITVKPEMAGPRAGHLAPQGAGP